MFTITKKKSEKILTKDKPKKTKSSKKLGEQNEKNEVKSKLKKKRSKVQVKQDSSDSEESDFNSSPDSKYFPDKYRTYEELYDALRKAGVESCQLIVGIDFTKSNSWQGGLPYYVNTHLHTLSNVQNPYQQVLNIMGRTLESFDDDHLIPEMLETACRISTSQNHRLTPGRCKEGQNNLGSRRLNYACPNTRLLPSAAQDSVRRTR